MTKLLFTLLRPVARIGLVALLFSCLPMTSLTAQERADAQTADAQTADAQGAADAELVQPFLRPTTCLILKVNLAQIDFSETATKIHAVSPDAAAAYASALQILDAGSGHLRDLVDGQPIFLTVGIPVSRTRLPIHLVVKKTSDARAEELVAFLTDQFRARVSVRDNLVVAIPAGVEDDRAPATSAWVTPLDVISEALRAVEDYPFQLLVVPPQHVWRTLRELAPELPRPLGGGPSSVLTEGVRWAALGADPARLRTTVVIQSSSASAAGNFAAHLPAMLKSAGDAARLFHDQLPAESIQALIDWLQPQVAGSRVTIHMDGPEKMDANLALLASMTQAIEDRTRGHSNQQRLRRILLGMHNYYDAHKVLPPADKYRGADGKHHLSWRVHLLPYIEAGELYHEFRLDEPWDSPHNAPLIAKMPDVYASLGLRRVMTPPGHTTFLAPVGDETIFGGSKSTTFQQIIDGSSNTIAVVEVTSDRAVPWTAPQDFVFDPQNPLVGIRRGGDGRWLCAFADGSVHQLPGSVSNQTILRLFRMNDGQSIDHHELR